MWFIFRFWAKVSRLNFGAIIFSAVSVIVFSSISIYWIEPGTFEKPSDALWLVMTTVYTVGYGDLSPKTTEGRLFFMLFVYPIGYGTVALFVAKLFDVITSFRRLREEGKLSFKGTAHYILIGWSKKTETAVYEIFDAEPDAHIVLIDEKETTPMFHHNLHYIRGDASEEETLLKANVLQSKSVSIFSDDTMDALSADGKSLLVASAVESLSAMYSTSIYTVVEIMKETHLAKFKHAKVNEPVLSTDSVSRLMAQAMLHNGSSEFFYELLSKKEGENLYEITSRAEWGTYREAFLALMEQGAILVWDTQKKAVNNKMNETIPEGSRLFVICDEHAYKRIS
ncbi:ion channel [Fictibacillus iocasae]|uniref:Ion channel n=1 Tax=Fictibacillus iocasae TaxID=2715437 RepID=A0ABW2NI83_9BACL